MKSVKFRITDEAPGSPPRIEVISSFPCAIGRSKDCGLRLDHVTVSDLHAIVLADGQGIFLRDNETGDGVLMDGERVGEVRLSSGHRFQIGHVILEVLHVSDDPVGLVEATWRIAQELGRKVAPPSPRGADADERNYLGEAAYSFVAAATVSAAIEFALKSGSLWIAALGAGFYVLGTAAGALLFSAVGRYFWGEWKLRRLLWFFGIVQLINVFVIQTLPVLRFQFGSDSLQVRALEAFGLAVGAAGWWYYSERFTESWGRKVFAVIACLQLLGAAAAYSRYFSRVEETAGFEEIYRPLFPVAGKRYSKDRALEELRDSFKRLESRGQRRIASP